LERTPIETDPPQSSAAPAAPPQAEPPPGVQPTGKWVALAIVGIGVFMATLDVFTSPACGPEIIVGRRERA